MTILSLEYLKQQASEEAPFEADVYQQQLTTQLLEVGLDALRGELWRIRDQFDETVSETLKGHPRIANYPTGFCLEISIGVLQLLNQAITSSATPVMRALNNFIANGGRVKRIWGNLRHQYFQNAMQWGSLYVDVANDSVDRKKPKIEILPFAEANLHPINDYDSYAALAETYWKGKIYPNRYCPHLAPMFPLLLMYPNGKWQLHSCYQTMLFQSLVSDFELAEHAIFSGNYASRRIAEAELKLLQKQFERAQMGNFFCTHAADDTLLQSRFADARRSELRFDAKKLQALLDQAQHINRFAL